MAVQNVMGNFLQIYLIEKFRTIVYSTLVTLKS